MAGINAGDAKLVFESSEEVKIAPTFVRRARVAAPAASQAAGSHSTSRTPSASRRTCCAASTPTVRGRSAQAIVRLLTHICTDFEKPSAIQQRAILPIVRGRDVIAQAQSGTGKTATFSISMLQAIDTTLRETQALVLSPTRELATQIQSVVLALGDYMNVQCHACIGE